MVLHHLLIQEGLELPEDLVAHLDLLDLEVQIDQVHRLDLGVHGHLMDQADLLHQCHQHHHQVLLLQLDLLVQHLLLVLLVQVVQLHQDCPEVRHHPSVLVLQIAQ